MKTQNTTYNGWSNYATWRVNLEMFDSEDWSEVTPETDVCDLVDELKASLEMYVDESSYGKSNSFVRGWIDSFLGEVNFYEIAEHIIDNSKEANS